ncbi:MAG TPA: T9SS type A sorting domain-containing protein [Bacteroidota bacterium]|nr:T9SS type A sorting domain-containing protein [Bacteroidota bacterium]
MTGISKYESPNVFVATSQSGYVALVSPENGLSLSKNIGRSILASAVSANISFAQGKHIALGTADGYVYLFDGNLSVSHGFPVKADTSIVNPPALADIDGDGIRDIIVCSSNKIYAFNSSGAVLDHFPITVPTNGSITTSPIVADVEGFHQNDIVVVTTEGLVYAYEPSGQICNGFPLSIGSNNGSTPAVVVTPAVNGQDSLYLYAESADGYVYGWNIFPSGNNRTHWQPAWGQYQHDAQGTGLEDSVLTPTTPSYGFLPASRAYNWPNPVNSAHNYRTHIRFFLGQSATVTIKLFDLAGDLVDQLHMQGIGGVDNEIEWDASKVQSGIYFAHIDAQGTSQQAAAVIKVAVIK